MGASDRPGSLGHLLWNNLTSFRGEVVPVSPTRATVAGRSTVPSLRDVPGPIDLAVVAVPAAQAPVVAGDAAAAGVAGLLVLSGGFAETGGDGARLEADLLAAARAGGVRVIGPNCFGIQHCDLGLNASMATGLPAGGEGISLVTQSGAYGMAVHTVGMDDQARFASVVSIGNAADVSAAEVVAHLGEDRATRVICVLLEGATDGRAFVDAAGAAAAHIPVVVAKTGRSAAGARAARSHTAALAGRAELWDAALHAVGVTVARSGLEMLDAARALATQVPPGRARAAIVTNSGGTGVELADLLDAEGIAVPALSPTLQGRLGARLPAHGSATNPVDLTPSWQRFAELYPAVVDELARSGEVDVVVLVLLQRAAADQATVEALRDACVRLRAAGVDTMVAVCWVAGRRERAGADTLQRAGIPCFDWPERTARAVGHAVRRGRAASWQRPPSPEPRGPALPETGRVDPLLAVAVLRASGVPVAPTKRAASVDDAVAAAAALGYPVVVKVGDAAVAHRTDIGGVRTGLADATAVRAAAGDLLSLTAWGLLVQPHLDGAEVAVGAVRDAQLGPMVMVGLGGVHVEVLGDVVFAPAPLTVGQARRLLEGLRGLPVLTGARGAPRADLDALADVVRGTGDLIASRSGIAEIDLNPVLATPAGAVAVDWKLVVGDIHPDRTGPLGSVRPPTTSNGA